MENQKLLKLNRFINSAYECFSFTDFLKHAIIKLHELVMYDSGMFFCSISRDSSFFKPYIGGAVEDYYKTQTFYDREEYLKQREEEGAGSESLVYKALDFKQGVVNIGNEPRSDFLASQDRFYIACVRIVYKGQFLGEIYLHRSKDKPDFDNEDMFTLRLLQPHVSTVFNIIHTVKAIEYIETDNVRMSKIGVCLLDSEMSIKGGNVTGLDMLKMPTIFGSSVLYHVKGLCEDMLSEQKTNDKTVLRTTSLKTGSGSLLISLMFCMDNKQYRNGQFFISMNFEDEESAISDYKLKFTKREADIIDGIIQGKNNAQLANSLNLSENTIKTHIQNIYRKVGANNRTELAYILMMNKK